MAPLEKSLKEPMQSFVERYLMDNIKMNTIKFKVSTKKLGFLNQKVINNFHHKIKILPQIFHYFHQKYLKFSTINNKMSTINDKMSTIIMHFNHQKKHFFTHEYYFLNHLI